MSGQGRLQIYVAAHCIGLERALEMVLAVRTLRPEWEVRVVDLDDATEQIPDFVVATPVYVADDRPIFWGNPSLDSLLAKLEKLEQRA